MKKSVIFLNPNKNDSYSRSILPSYFLSKICGIQSNYYWMQDVNSLRNFDVIVVKNIFQLSFIECLVALGKKVIYDIDFDIFNIPKDDRRYGFYKDNTIRNILNILKKVDAIIVNSKRLRTIYRKFNNNIYVISDCIDLSIWNIKEVDKNKIAVVSFGNHKSNINYMFKGIEKIAKNYNKLEFIFMNCKPKNIKFKHSIIKSLSEQDYMDKLQKSKCAITLLPLSPNKFNMSASNIGILNSWACNSIPIASNWSEYSKTINKNNGFMVRENGSWFDVFKKVYDNYDEIKPKMVDNISHSLIKYDIKSNIDRWKSIFFKI